MRVKNRERGEGRGEKEARAFVLNFLISLNAVQLRRRTTNLQNLS